MPDNKRDKEEHLERLWHMKERGDDGIENLADCIGGHFDVTIVDELSAEGWVHLDETNRTITLTRTGEEYAGQLVRAHRLAERLLHDVFGGEHESAACEFEHMVAHELVDGICTLLGHPRECPHGMPIPKGECCRRSVKAIGSSVVPLTELKVGEAARVAYVNCENDRQIHRMDGLHIRPGAMIRLHQKYPSHVIECEDATIALDANIAASVRMWLAPRKYA
ncbi:metal-dependent transcriptional regulator [Verrucomicrobiota bacterium]